MASGAKTAFLEELKKYGPLRKLDKSQSLYEIGDGMARIYIRYSRPHTKGRSVRVSFYGLRQEDLRKLEGHPSLICFLWDSQKEPLIVPFSGYEEVFQSTSPAGDGQYKVQIYPQEDGTELYIYIARTGRFNVEGHFGWGELESLIDSARIKTMPEFSVVSL